MQFRVDIDPDNKEKIIASLKNKFPGVVITLNTDALFLNNMKKLNIAEIRTIIETTPGVNESTWMA